MAADAQSLLLDWTSDNEFALGATSYVCVPIMTPDVRSIADRFCIVKPRSLVERYAQLIRETAPKKIFELGIWDGGSTAFLAQYAHPTKLVAIDQMPGPCTALASFIETHRLGDTVKVLYGVDQNDTGRILEILDQEYPDESLDLVVDDASHLVNETRQSFNALFPRLAPGGTYAIEDWRLGVHDGPSFGGRFQDAIPLSVLVFELLLLAAYRPTLIDEVVLNEGWALFRRGPEPVANPASFDVSASYGTAGRELMRKISRSDRI